MRVGVRVFARTLPFLELASGLRVWVRFSAYPRQSWLQFVVCVQVQFLPESCLS